MPRLWRDGNAHPPGPAATDDPSCGISVVDPFADVFSIENGVHDPSTDVDDTNNIDFTIGDVPTDYFEMVEDDPDTHTSGIQYRELVY